MAEITEVIPEYITTENGILEELRRMRPEVFNRRVNAGLSIYNLCKGSLLDGQNPYSIELFEDNETNKKMWKRILRELNLFETHKFEIVQWSIDGIPQFHPDRRPKMLVFIMPKHPSGGGKKSSSTKGGHKRSTKGDEEKNPVNK